MTAPKPRFWVNTVSLEHVLGGVEGGFTQADHGSDKRIRQMHLGDQMVFYSPRTALRSGKPLQQFTAIGVVIGAEPYQVRMSETFRPWRVAVEFESSTPVDARPLVPRLSFIKDKKKWGFPFRRGLFAIPETDYALIADEMTGPTEE